MKQFFGLDVNLDLQNPVVAVGSFDGVHRGHCLVLQQLVAIARQCDGSSVVVTFDPHPREVLQPQTDFFRINTLQRNVELIAAQGIDAVVVIPFTTEFAKWSYAEFIRQFVVGRLQAHALVMGPHHAMGRNREGNNENIRQICLQYGVRTIEIPELAFEQMGVHSAEIRKSILDGDFQKASQMLGYPYELLDDKR